MDASCGNTYNEDSQIIHTLNYPKMHPKETSCTWSIAAPIGFQISVEPFFYSMGYVESGHLRIYDGTNSDSRKIADLNGIDKYNGTTSTTNTMFFEFASYWEALQGIQTTISLIGRQMDFIY